MTYPITEDMLPCIIQCYNEPLLINRIQANGCYYNNSWICEWEDNPQLIITIAELRHYFPERCI